MLTAVAKRQIEATVIRKYRLKTSLVKKRGALIDATNLHNANGRAVLQFDRLHKAGTLARHIEPRKPVT
jgi:predicted kinase